MASSDKQVHLREVSIQRDFLPAALEIQETPPSPAGRALIWILLLLFALGLLWSVFGKVDIVITGQGHIIPSDRVKTVQSLHSGSIAALLISEGQQVEKGDPLLLLDTTNINAEKSRLEGQLADIQSEVFWRKGLENWLVAGGRHPNREDVEQQMPGQGFPRARNMLAEKITEFSAEVLGREKALSGQLSELDGIQAEHQRTLATLAILSKRVNAYRSLVEKQQGARIQYLELLQQQEDLEQSIPVLAARQRQVRTNVNAAHAQISAFISETRSQNLLEITRLESDASILSHDLNKVLYSKRQHTVTAPVTGSVEDLLVHTVGGVLSAGEAIMKIVPEGVAVEVDALLENKDIGFVHEGQNAEVKIDTFNFTRYGVIQADVLDVSEDATEDNTGAWKYRMRLGLREQHIVSGDKLLKLTPGMSASVEVKIGTRRIIEFLLTPLLRYRHESLRER